MIFDARHPITIASCVILTVYILGFWIYSYALTEAHDRIEALRTNLETWNTLKPTSFKYVVSFGCMYIESFEVEILPERTHIRPFVEQSAKRWLYIEQIFNQAESAILTAHKANIKYHPYFGFPQLIDADWNKDTVDDECFTSVSDFEVL